MISEFKKNKNRVPHDFYATDTNEVINILQYEELNGVILEPCCGLGHITKGLEQCGYTNVISTDLINRGFGIGNLDYLDENYPYNEVDCIITNPPYSLINEFIKKSLSIIKNKLIIHCRIQCLEGEKRYEQIFKDNPPSRVYIYVDRIDGLPNGKKMEKQARAMVMSWVVWDKQQTNNVTELKWIRRYNKNGK